MSLLFLTNAAGNSATTLDTQGNGTTNVNYKRTDAMTGPRSTFHRGDIYAGQTALAYYFTADVDLNYAVVARADKLLTVNTSRLRLFERDTLGIWTVISGSDNNPLVA